MIRGKAPLRISFAGGGTDLNYIFERYGGAIVSSTIDKYCHMTIEKRRDKKMFINEKKLSEKEHLANAVIKYYKPKFGFNLYYYNDLPVESGLGSSSSFTVLLLRLLNELDNKRPIDEELVKDAYNIETTFKEGGWQDQYASAIGGFNFMEFDAEQTRIYPLRLKYSFICELNEHIILFYIGGTKKEDTHKNLREYSEKHLSEMERTANIKTLAYEMRDCLLNQKIDNIPSILKHNWKLKKNKFTSTSRVDKIYDLAMKNGAEGGKLCGSGRSGHFIFFCKLKNRSKLTEALKNKGKIIDFNFSIHGVETW